MENLDELMKKYPLNNMEESKDLRDYTSDNLVSSLPIESECKDIDFEWEYPIFDQSKKGNVGSCCGHGGAAVEDFIFNVNPVDEDLFSPYWLYAYREPIYHQGHGMFESDITRNLTKIGGVKLKDFDYPGIEYPAIKEKINEIGIDKLLKIAANYRLESYIHIKPSEVKGWLNEHGTIGFVIVKAYENFYESLNNGGHFPKEGKGKCIGSHCMPFKGVVDGKLKMPNSWGKDVGDNGIFDIDIDSDTIVSVTVFPEARHIRKPIEKKYVAGWNKIDGADWNTAENKWQYSKDGLTLVKNDWIQDKSKWYYLDENGVMLTGWFKDSKGDWYYLDIDKGYAYTGWVFINGNWYYFDSSCRMLKGWQYINEEWFYLRDVKESDDKPEGSMFTGWKISQDCSKWYYLNENHTDKFDKGVCVHDCTMTIDNKSYTFNSDGAWIEDSFVSDNLIEFIKGWEDFYSHAYYDGTGYTDAQLTIGYGTTKKAIPQAFPNGIESTCTVEEATKWLKQEVNKCAKEIKDALGDVQVSQNIFDCMVDIAYNNGTGDLIGGNTWRALISGNSNSIETWLMKWCHANGEEYEGLKKRCAARVNMALYGIYDSTH